MILRKILGLNHGFLSFVKKYHLKPMSIVQMISALSILGLLIYFSVHSVRANGRSGRHWIMWICWFFSLAGTGVSEYLVQRHGNWFVYCYSSMTVCVFFMAFIVWRMYLTCCRE